MCALVWYSNVIRNFFKYFVIFAKLSKILREIEPKIYDCERDSLFVSNVFFSSDSLKLGDFHLHPLPPLDTALSSIGFFRDLQHSIT